MRMRNKPWAMDFLNEHGHIVDTDSSYAGNIQGFFPSKQPIHVEIGTGMGTFIIEMAKRNPGINYVGIELDKNVLIRVVEKVKEEGLGNIKLVLLDARRLEEYFGEEEVERIYLNFSDPWPKNRHEKRRLTHEGFLEGYRKIMYKEGRVEFKTDNRGLFEFSLRSMNNYGMAFEEVILDLHADEPPENIRTEYENKFSAQGNKIYRLKASF